MNIALDKQLFMLLAVHYSVNLQKYAYIFGMYDYEALIASVTPHAMNL